MSNNVSKSTDVLLQALDDKKITFLQFMNSSEFAGEFKRWCEEHSVVEDEASAELFFDMHGFDSVEDELILEMV